MTAPWVTPVYTVGHSSRRLDGLLLILRAARVSIVADVRRYPASRRFPWFRGPALRAALAQAGIGYEHFEDLGGLRDPPDDPAPFAGLAPLWRGYAAHMSTPAFVAAAERLLETARDRGPVAVLCAERDPAACHRSLLADWISLRGAAVVHLLDLETRRPHELHALARLEAGRLTYRPRQPPLL